MMTFFSRQKSHLLSLEAFALTCFTKPELRIAVDSQSLVYRGTLLLTPLLHTKLLPRNYQCNEEQAGTGPSRLVLHVTRETFLVPFLGPTGTIWRLPKTL